MLQLGSASLCCRQLLYLSTDSSSCSVKLVVCRCSFTSSAEHNIQKKQTNKQTPKNPPSASSASRWSLVPSRQDDFPRRPVKNLEPDLSILTRNSCSILPTRRPTSRSSSTPSDSCSGLEDGQKRSQYREISTGPGEECQDVFSPSAKVRRRCAAASCAFS